MGIDIRTANPVADAHLITAIDTTVRSDVVFEVVPHTDGFVLVELPAEPPVVKTFPIDDLDAARWDQAWLAFADGEPVGFIATQREAWNSRVIIGHFYVSSSHRRRGIGRRLLETALAAAHRAGARQAWLETSNVNVPGFRAYERLGFRLVGLDTSLYENTAASGEVALFLGRRLD